MIVNIYKELYSDRKNLGELRNNLRIKKMVSMVDKMQLESKNILDIGCYDGTFLSLIKNRKNNFYGLEASDWGFHKSLEKGIGVQKYFFDNLTALPYRDKFFDLVIAGEIIEHIFDTDFFLKEIHRILKLKGKLIISTPNVASLGRRLLLLFGLNPIIEVSPNELDSSGHIHYFTFDSLKNLLEKHNFEIIKSQSDCVNFSKSGKIKSALLAEICPTLGASIIYLARK
jgi:methionine biosynthesis protein MetW